MRLFLPFLCIVVLFSCTDPYEFENELCDCYRKEFAKNDKDFDLVLKELEDFYLAQGVFETNEGTSYKAFVKKALNSNTPPIPVVPENLLAHFKLLHGVVNDERCASLQSNRDEEPKLEQIAERLMELSLDGEQITEGQVLTVLDAFLTADDYNHPIYKLQLFTILFNLSIQEMDVLPN